MASFVRKVTVDYPVESFNGVEQALWETFLTAYVESKLDSLLSEISAEYGISWSVSWVEE